MCEYIFTRGLHNGEYCGKPAIDSKFGPRCGICKDKKVIFFDKKLIEIANEKKKQCQIKEKSLNGEVEKIEPKNNVVCQYFCPKTFIKCRQIAFYKHKTNNEYYCERHRYS